MHFRPIIQQLKTKNTKIINRLSNNSTYTHKRKNLYLHTYISNTTKKPKTPKNTKNTKIRNPANPASIPQQLHHKTPKIFPIPDPQKTHQFSQIFHPQKNPKFHPKFLKFFHIKIFSKFFTTKKFFYFSNFFNDISKNFQTQKLNKNFYQNSCIYGKLFNNLNLKTSK